MDRRFVFVSVLFVLPLTIATAGTQASFAFDGPSAHRGRSEATCEAVGLRFSAAPLEVLSESGVLVVRRTFVNRTLVGPGPGVVAPEDPPRMQEDSIVIPAGTLHVRPAPAGILVGVPYNYPVDDGGTFEVRWNASAVNLSAPTAAMPTAAGDLWVRQADAVATAASAFPDWARFARIQGHARAEGDLALYVREADIEWANGRQALGPYVSETANVSTPGASHRTLEMTDAFLRLRGAAIDLPPDAEPVCRGLHARLDGSLTIHGATGSLPTANGPTTVEGRAITLAGHFALQETPSAQPLVSGARGRVQAEASGDVALVAVDFANLAAPPPSNTLATAGLGAALLLALSALVRYAGVGVGFLYSRFGRDRALENRNRDLVYEAVRHNPGVDLSTLARITALNRRTVDYHVQVLTRVGLVGTRRHGRSRRIIPSRLLGPQEVATILATQDPRYAQVVEAVRAAPLPLSQLVRLLQARLGLGRRAAYDVVERAVHHGIVQRSDDGREVRLKCAASP